MICLFDAPSGASHDLQLDWKENSVLIPFVHFLLSGKMKWGIRSVTFDGNNRNGKAHDSKSCISCISQRKNYYLPLISQFWNNVLFRPIIGHSRRRSCWLTTWWRLLGTPALSSMTTPAALASTWRWSSPVEEQWLERRYLSTCWRNLESSTRQCNYHILLSLSFSVFL